jgi:hypothetical protein
MYKYTLPEAHFDSVFPSFVESERYGENIIFLHESNINDLFYHISAAEVIVMVLDGDLEDIDV